jgi:hypothetical protein
VPGAGCAADAVPGRAADAALGTPSRREVLSFASVTRRGSWLSAGLAFRFRQPGGWPPAALLEAAVAADVRRTVHEVLETPECSACAAQGNFRLVGAVFELTTGRVRFLE